MSCPRKKNDALACEAAFHIANKVVHIEMRMGREYTQGKKNISLSYGGRKGSGGNRDEK